jgi:hypothetical protein
MKTCFNVVALLFVAVFSVGCADRATRPQPLPGHEDEVAEAMLPCPDSLERFLPGEYYFCAGARDYWIGRLDDSALMFRYAAEWANKPAQYALGLMYFNGDHQPKNRPLGIAWFALAAERHDVQYEATFVSAYRSATAEERAQANTYWKAMHPVYSDKVAAARAIRRYDRELTPLYQSIATNGGYVYLAGLNFGGSALAVEQLMRGARDKALKQVDGTVTVGDMPTTTLGTLVGPPATQGN